MDLEGSLASKACANESVVAWRYDVEAIARLHLLKENNPCGILIFFQSGYLSFQFALPIQISQPASNF